MRKVLILLGSQNDLSITDKGLEVLRSFNIAFELRIASAHLSPRFVEELVKGFEAQGGQVIFCVAGLSAHLAGVVAAMSVLPVLAIPLPGSAGAGLDVLLSMSQMPAGTPVATMTLGEAGFTHAALFACQILGLKDAGLSRELQLYRQSQSAQVLEADAHHQVIFDV